MKKIAEAIKPYLSIVLGALLFLYYLNWLSLADGALAIGIIAVILSAYYLGVGIAGVILGEKMSKGLRKVFDIASIVSFAVFMFVFFLIKAIKASQVMGPTGWVIVILSMIVSLALAVVYLLAKIINNKLLSRFAHLFAVIFALVLSLNVLFDVVGDPIVLGKIDIIGLVIYALFGYMLFISLTMATCEVVEIKETKEEANEPEAEEVSEEPEENK